MVWGKFRQIPADGPHKKGGVQGRILATDDCVQHKNGPADYATETADDGTTIYLTHVIGASEELGTSLGGVAVIFNDPGTTYAYRTTKVWADAFRGNADLRVVRFHGANSGSVHTDVKMELGSYAFAECPALQYVDLVYGNTNTNRYEALQPDQIVPTDNTLLLGSSTRARQRTGTQTSASTTFSRRATTTT